MKVLITGTASGIGKGCAEFFLKRNHEVYGFDKNISSIQHPKIYSFLSGYQRQKLLSGNRTGRYSD